jgi:hypothetical protein
VTRIRRAASLLALAAVAAAALVAVAAPASGHTGRLFTVSEIADPLRQIGTIDS